MMWAASEVTLVGYSRSFEDEWLRIYQSSGTDDAIVQETFLNTSKANMAPIPTPIVWPPGVHTG
jgi:hypothetical protein